MTKSNFTKDYADIKHVLIDFYTEGNKQGNSQIMKKAFLDNATMYFIGDDGKLAGGPVTESLYPIVDTFDKADNAKVAIAYINVNGDVAQARLDTDDLNGTGFTDYFNLIKVDNQWKIISKIYQSNY